MNQTQYTTPAQHRGAYVAGLRRLADVLEQHPAIPLPTDGRANQAPISLFFSDYDVDGDVPAAMAAAVRAFGGSWAKDHRSSSYFRLTSQVGGGLGVALSAPRGQVCERVKTGTQSVTRTVPDPAALAQVPEVEVTEEIETFEWRCSPILAAAGSEQDAQVPA